MSASRSFPSFPSPTTGFFFFRFGFGTKNGTKHPPLNINVHGFLPKHWVSHLLPSSWANTFFFSQGMAIQAIYHLNPLNLETQVVFYFHNDRLGTENSPSTPTLRLNRLLLRQWLSTGINVQYGRVASKIERVGDKMGVSFTNGTTAIGDILIGADGANSIGERYTLYLRNISTKQLIRRQ